MSQILLFSLEILVNAVEVFLFLFLIKSKLVPKNKNRFLFPISFLAFTALICLLNFLYFPYLFSFLFIFALNMVYAILFFENSFVEKLFWGSIFTFIKIFAEKFTLWMASIIFASLPTDFLIGGNNRFPAVLIYSLTCLVFVIIFRKIEDKPFSLPKKLQVALILLMTFGIYIADSLLSLIVEAEIKSIHSEFLATLNRINYLFLLLIISIIFMIKWIGSIYSRNMELLEEIDQERAEMQQFELLAETTQTLREWKHDYKNNLGVISLLLDDGRYERAESYIKELLDSDTTSAFKLSSGNTVLDAIVSTKITAAKKIGIEFEHMIFLPDKVPLSALDFSTIMGNFLDNALEACERLDKTVKPFIKLDIKPYHDMLYIEICNSANGDYHYNAEGKLVSSKKEKGHGIGVKRSIRIIEKYQGIYQQQAEDKTFTMTIMIPMKTQDGSNEELEPV